MSRCRKYAETTAALVTAIALAIGYDTAARIFKKALAEDKSIRQVILEEGLMTAQRLDAILDLRALTAGGRRT